MLKNLLRPKWQHPNPEVRAKVLAQGGVDPEITVRMAISDPVLRVRQSAVAALTDIAALTVLAERCPELRVEIAAALEPLLLPREAGAELRERELVQAVALLDDRQRLKLLQSAASVRLRVLALRGVSDNEALCTCALGDEDIHVRKAAIARIECPETLARIAERSGSAKGSLAELARRRAGIVREARARAKQRGAVLTALQGMLDGDRPLTEPAWDKQRAAWEAVAGEVSEREQAVFDELADAIAPKLEAQRRRRAADQARARQREQILEQLDQLARHAEGHELEQFEIALGMLERAWSELEPMEDRLTERRLQERFAAALGETRTLLEQRRAEQARQRLVTPALEGVEQILAGGRLGDEDLRKASDLLASVEDRFKDKASLADQRQRLRHLVERVARRLEDQQAQDRQRVQHLKERLDALESALQGKELKPALKAADAAQALLKELGEQPPSEVRELERRLRRSEPELRGLKSWASWGNDHARQELIDEARALPDEGLGVEELGKRLKRLRRRWKSLGRLGPGGKAQWEAFDAACTRAHEPIKASREADKAQRRAHLEAREALCAEAESLTESTDWERPDWRALDKTLHELRRRWREAGPVPHKDWTKVLGRFDQAISDFDARLEKERRRNFLQRQALVREAEQLAEQGDARNAVAAAKELRARWQVTVRSRQKEERELWASFSEAMDRVFGKDRAERDRFKAGLDDELRRGDSLCERLEALADLDTRRLLAQRGEIAQLEEAFGALGEVPKQARRGLEQRFTQASERLRGRLRAAQEQRLAQALEGLYRRHRLCERLEEQILNGRLEAGSIEDLTAQWDAVEPDDVEPEVAQRLQRRWERALSAAREGPEGGASLDDLEANRAARRRICLELEVLLGCESPEAEREERMARQVELLQAAMSGGEGDRAERVRRLKLDYLGLGASSIDEELTERFERMCGTRGDPE